MVIGSLVTNVVANLSGWGSNLKKARTDLGKFSAGISTFQGVVAGATTGAVATFIKQTIDEASALHDTAEKLNINVEALQELRHVADQMGTSSGTLEGSLRFLNKTLGQASSGSEKAIDKFSALGLSIDELKGHGLDENFKTIIDSIRSIKDPTEQAAAAVSVFGRAGQDLLPIIRAGGDEVERMSQGLRDMGGVASEDSINSLEAVGDQIAELTKTFDALKIQVVALAAPALASAFREWADALREVNTALKEIVNGGALEKIGGAAGLITKLLKFQAGGLGIQSAVGATLNSAIGETPKEPATQKNIEKNTEASVDVQKDMLNALSRLTTASPANIFA